MQIGNNLQYILRLFNLSVKEMSAIMGKSEGNYSKIERNKIGITMSNALVIAEFFEIKIDELVNKGENSLALTINKKGSDYMMLIFEKIKKHKKFNFNVEAKLREQK